MIIGLGTDVVNISRIEKILEHNEELLIKRIMTPIEQKNFAASKQVWSLQQKACVVAKVFAVKEACVKALGTGFRHGISWQNMELSHLANGKPELSVNGKAGEILNELADGAEVKIHVSLSDDYPIAHAVLILETIA